MADHQEMMIVGGDEVEDPGTGRGILDTPETGRRSGRTPKSTGRKEFVNNPLGEDADNEESGGYEEEGYEKEKEEKGVSSTAQDQKLKRGPRRRLGTCILRLFCLE